MRVLKRDAVRHDKTRVEIKKKEKMKKREKKTPLTEGDQSQHVWDELGGGGRKRQTQNPLKARSSQAGVGESKRGQ